MAAAYFREWEPLLGPMEIAGGSLLVVSPHADDEVIGAGGLICGHRLAGQEVLVAILTDGRLGDPGGDQSAVYVRKRQAECIEAAAVMDTNLPQFLGFPDGELASLYGNDDKGVGASLKSILDSSDFAMLALPSPYELHPDHKAAFLFGFDAWAEGGRKERLILYEVGSLMPCNFLLNITDLGDQKDKALACYESQLVHHDITAKMRALDQARCANIPDSKVGRCEGYIEVTAASADDFRRLVDELLIVTDSMKPGHEDE